MAARVEGIGVRCTWREMHLDGIQMAMLRCE